MKDHSTLGIWCKCIYIYDLIFCVYIYMILFSNSNGRLNATEMTAETKND